MHISRRGKKEEGKMMGGRRFSSGRRASSTIPGIRVRVLVAKGMKGMKEGMERAKGACICRAQYSPFVIVSVVEPGSPPGKETSREMIPVYPKFKQEGDKI